MSSIEKQIQAFVAGTASEYAFPGLSVDERKLVKITAEKFGLSSSSFGMGNERQIHIFKPASALRPALEPVKYSVKNTFVDGPLDASAVSTEQALVEPAHHSMPVGALQEHIAAEEQGFTAMVLSKVNGSPRNSEVDTSSTKDNSDSDSEQQDPQISIKNSFVHFEIDSKEIVDPRIIQSMPAGTFAEHIGAEKRRRPLPLSEASENEGSSAMLFPSTPNADNEMSFVEHSQGGPVVQWMSAAVSEPVTVLPAACWAPTAPPPPPPQGQPQESMTVLPPAFWAPQAPVPMPVPGVVQTVSQNENSPPAMPAMQGSVTPQGLSPQPLPQPVPATATAPQESITVLPHAVWAPSASPLDNDMARQGPPQGPVQGLQQGSTPPMPPQGAAPPMPPQGAAPAPPMPPQGSTPPIPPQGAAPTLFMPGTHVVLQGLANQPDFNGLRGTVSAFDANCGRYNILIEIGSSPTRRMVKVKFQNLLLAQPPCPISAAQQTAVMSRPGKASLVLDQMV